FYTSALGMRVTAEAQDELALGTEERTLLVLHALPGAVPARRVSGLYHFAVLLPSRAALAGALLRLVEHNIRLQGVADHGVSEALYLADPDGNGIELYRDREEPEWPREADGSLQMGTEELDIDGLVASRDGAAPGQGLPDGTRMGHVHLHVSDLDRAIAFYRDIVGLALKQRYGPSAGFLAAGRYHHHVGVNTWAGVGAPQPPAGSTGLRWFELTFASDALLQAAAGRARAAGHVAEPFAEGLLLKDPAGNGVVLRLARPPVKE
ncbi:MAG: glyoxalase, partial [Actinobacteria bacterium]